MKARAQIEVHGRKFEIGQTVTGLSECDKKWMMEKGYIEDIQKEEKPKQQKKQDCM